MKARILLLNFLTITGLIITSCIVIKAETIQQWYNNAQQRIDTLRKGNFGIKIYDKMGNPYAGNISIRMIKHEYPFGIAFDLYEGSVNYGNTYRTEESITATSDAEIYKSERWYSFISYNIPVEKDKNFKVTLKFAEIYFSKAESRLFDVVINGQKVLSNFDVYANAGGKNIAIDTTFSIYSNDTILNIEFIAIKDNAAIKGIEIRGIGDDWIKRINCGGEALTTREGNYYESDTGYFNKSASRVPTEEEWMKAAMQKYFNYGVSGNSFKWSGIQPQHTAPNYTNFDNAVKWAQSIGWNLKAHTLLWGGYNYEDDHAIPRWVKDLPTPKAIYDTCKMRVTREVSHYKGIIKEYDVMNEPLHALYLASVVGDSINWNCFKWARSVDSTANLIINDYNVEYNWGDARKYRDLIINLKNHGAPITGVGMQAHFWQGMRPNLEELVTNVNIVAEAGLPIKFTEFDNGILTEKEQAEDFVLVTTIAFSHPMMNGIICWGLSDKGAWREKSGLFYENHKPKLAADTLLYLTKNKWATNFDTIIEAAQPLFFNAYFGSYNIEVNFGDTTKIFEINCNKVNKDSVFVLNELDAVVKGPDVVSVNLENSNTLKLAFNKEIKRESLNKSNFKFFSDNLLRIQNILLDSLNTKDIFLIFDKNISPDDYLLVSYFPGSLSSTDGGKARVFGPIPVTNLTTGLISGTVINDGTAIEATFNAQILNLLENSGSFTVSVNGSPVAIQSIAYKDNDSSKAIFNLAIPIQNKDKVTLQYTKGSLKPKKGFDCENSNIAVSNVWPSLVNAEVSNNGKEIYLLFNTLLKNVNENKDAFVIKVDDQLVDFSDITETGIDSSKICLKLPITISKNQKVSVSYNPGNIKSMNNNSLLAFENAVVKNLSIVTSIDPAPTEFSYVFPNPANEFLNIASDIDLINVVIVNIEGKICYQSRLKSKSLIVDVRKFNPGIYYVKVIDVRGQIKRHKIIII
jgi:uncharacterized repeat protein (TIGR02059 family)